MEHEAPPKNSNNILETKGLVPHSKGSRLVPILMIGIIRPKNTMRNSPVLPRSRMDNCAY